MLTVDIPHGGSGEGWSKWSRWAAGCLLACDFEDRFSLPCSNCNLVIGTMVHEYLRLWRSNEITDNERVDFIDTKCGPPPENEWQAEAYRLFKAYTKLREKEHFGKILEAELLIKGSRIEEHMGIAPYSAQIDLVVADDRGVVLVDYKTSGASGDSRYTQGHGLVQMHTYWMALDAIGLTPDRIFIEQITKTKTVKVNTYEIPLPSLVRQEEIREGLAAAHTRKHEGMRLKCLPLCDTCVWQKTGHCL